MTEFEFKVNGGKFDKKTIVTVIINSENGETFSANINAKSLSEIDKKLPIGYEMDIVTTLSNYFEPNTMEKFEIELNNSQFIYFSDFHDVVIYKIYDYIEALEKNDFNKVNEMNRKYSK